jgi:hypothetical protein
MAIDKIVLEFQAETTKLKKELEDLKSRLGNVETAAKDAGKNTGKALDDVGKNANGLKDTIKNLGQQIAAAFAAREIIRFTKQTIDAASDLNETLDKSRIIFGQASTAVENFASNSAKQFGMSKKEAIDAAASFGVFGKSAGKTGQDLASFSTDLVGLSADLASFNNTSPEEAALALGAALRGEAEPIRRFGVLLDDATLKQEALALGLIKTTKEALTPQNKVLAANSAIFKQTTDAQGNFILTSGGVANQQRILEASFKDLQTEIGQKLLPTFNSALSSLNEFISDLDAEDVLSFAKALGIAAAGFAGFKFGQLVQGLAATIQGMKGATLSVQGLSKVVAANPFGLIASAVAALIAYGPDLLDMMNGVTETQKEFDSVASSATENLRKEQAELNLLAEALRNTNPESEERAKYLKRFNELSPVAIKDLKDETKFNGQLQRALDEANKSFAARIKLRAAEAIAQKAAEIQLEEETKSIESRDKLLQSGMGINAKLLDEFAKRVKAGEVNTGFFDNSVSKFFETAKALGINVKQNTRNFGDVSNMIQQYAESQAKSAEAGEKLANVQKSIAETSKEVNVAVASNTEAEKEKAEAAASAAAASAAAAKERAKKILEINAQFNKEMMSLADELTLMMIADEDERGRKQLEIQKQNDLASIEAAEFSAEQKGQLKAKIEDKYNQLELTRQQAQNEKLKKAEEDYQRFLEEQGLQSEEGAKEAEDRKYSAYLELWQRKQENELLGIKNEKERKLRELAIQEENEIAKVEGTEYSEQIILEIKKKYAAKRVEVEKETQKQTYISLSDGLSTLSSNFGQMVSAFAQMSGEGAEYTKALAVVGVQIQMATALAAAIAGAVQAASATGPGAPFALAGYIAAMVGAVVGAFAQTQQLLTAEVPKPGFYDGTAYLQRGGSPKGKDTIPIMAHEGEAIIPTRNNLQYPGLAKSWIDGNLDGYINNNFVRPALMEQQRQAEEDFADRLASSMALQMSSNFDDYRLHRDLKEQTAVLRFGFETMKINRKKIRGGR